MTDYYLPVSGVKLAVVSAGLRYGKRTDVALFEFAPETVVSAVFTRNQFRAAPVVVAARHLSSCAPRYLLVNAGYANAGLGEQGIEDALHCCEVLAQSAGVRTCEVIPFSTGVIGERIPLEKIVASLPKLLDSLTEEAWLDAAQAIMTTDTVAKITSAEVECRGGRKIAITGIAKGAGMICPNMATMLAFIGTDIQVSQDVWDQLLIKGCEDSFNRITIDGDTSTNDACVLFATGCSGICWDDLNESDRQNFIQALNGVMNHLAEAIVRDAEGAKHFIRISVEKVTDVATARTIAYTIAHSPLVKTAIAASDPNWGRVLAAIGRANVPIDIDQVALYFGDVCIFKDGKLNPEYREADGIKALSSLDVDIRIVLNSGTEAASILTSDLTEEYVRINADYRS